MDIFFFVPYLIAPVVLVGGYRWLRRTRRTKVAGIALPICVAFYCVLSATGGYINVNHGGADNRTEWCSRYIVQPYITIRVHAELTPLGMLYWPCLVVDRVVWHPTGWSE